MSWTEEWKEVEAARARVLQYSHTNITVYFGKVDIERKLQLFRIEWAGVESISNGAPIFQGKWGNYILEKRGGLCETRVDRPAALLGRGFLAHRSLSPLPS